MTEKVYLATPDFSAENILGYNVGVRPYRQSGVRIEAEKMQDKLLIHNYGYGGAGLTLCWGGVQEVLRLLQQYTNTSANIAILGAGVIGLATAYDLLRQGHHVNIYADNFSPHLTSNVAAGILSPPENMQHLPAKKQTLLQDMFTASMQRYQAIARNAEFAGVQQVTDYRFDLSVRNNNHYASFSIAEKNVEVHFDNGKVHQARQIIELGLDGKIFMESLYQQIQQSAVNIQQKYFGRAEELNDLSEDIIINCTSMGSRDLFDDRDFTPIRGQLVYFKPQAGVDYSFYYPVNEADYCVKLYPWSDRLILGRVFERGEEECKVNQVVIDKMLELARKVL